MKIRNRFLYRTAQRLNGIARRTRKQDVVFVAWLERLEGTACCAPYVDCTVSVLTKNKVTENTTFKARIDTGADITCVPAEYAKPFMPVQLGRPVLIRGHNGRVVRAKTHKLLLTIELGNEESRTFRPERGVLLTNSDIGLIGMDVLGNFDLRLSDGRFTLKAH